MSQESSNKNHQESSGKYPEKSSGKSPDKSPERSHGIKWLKKLFNHSEIHNRQDFFEAISQAELQKLIDADAARMMKGVLSVSQMTAADIMIPRSQMTVLNLNTLLVDTLPEIIESTHSRFPVVNDENKDEVMGILLAKDLIKFTLSPDFPHLKIQSSMLRPAVFIPESKRLDSLLKEFRLSRNHLAVVVDEYGSVSGLVTIEDVLEQIVGEIEDEFDCEEDVLIKPLENHLGQQWFEVNALTPIEELNQFFKTSFSDERIDTLGGLILMSLGHVPEEGSKLNLPPFEILITQADTRHIIQVHLKLLDSAAS